MSLVFSVLIFYFLSYLFIFVFLHLFFQMSLVFSVFIFYFLLFYYSIIFSVINFKENNLETKIPQLPFHILSVS